MSHRRSSLLAALFVALGGAPALAQEPDAPASPAASPAIRQAPVTVRVGTQAVLSIREPLGEVTIEERAAVIQSRIDQVLLHHPYLTAGDVKVLRVGVTPVVYWGPFAIASADAAHARLNNYSSPDLLAHTWADNLREAARIFLAAKRMPARALYRNEKGSDFVYVKTDRTLDQPAELENTRYVFTPEDFEYGAGVRESGQQGFVVFVRKDAPMPPQAIYLGNPEGTFTEYEIVRPEDE